MNAETPKEIPVTDIDAAFEEELEDAKPLLPQTAVAELGDPFDSKDAIRQARMLIPVKDAGAAPLNFAQQIDFAQSMAKALYSLPAHLQGNVGDCLAIVDLASRAGGLSPYMVASLTYLDPSSKRLALMSQLYHALVAQSGLLIGDLDVTYEGEGGDRTCTVVGRLRSDGSVRKHTSPPLRDVHPGYSLKKKHADGSFGKRKISYAEGERMRAAGELGEGDELFASGSPLWSRKRDVQLFYDTSRDWVRIFTPTAALGMPSVGDFDHLPPPGPEGAKDVTGLAQRLVRREGAEGHADGHAERELANLAPDRPGAAVEVGMAGGDGGVVSGKASPAGATASPATQVAGKGKAAPAASQKRHKAPSAPPSKAAVQAAADKAESRSAATKAKDAAADPPAVPETAAKCKTPDEYIAYAKRWIDLSTKHAAAMDRFDEESAVRRRLKVPIKAGAELQGRIERKFEV